MYLIFPPEYEGLANAVFIQARDSYQYTSKFFTTGLVQREVEPTELIVTTFDFERVQESTDTAEFRWEILATMAQGAVFVNYDKPNTTHFYDAPEGLTTEDQIDKILVAGRFGESRAAYVQGVAPKAFYVGPTYTAPLATIVVTYDAKKDDNFLVDYDERVTPLLASLPEDLWTKTAFATARMGSTLQKLLDEFYETAIVTLDKKGSTKVGSLTHEQIAAPKDVNILFGRTLNNIVKTKEVDAV